VNLWHIHLVIQDIDQTPFGKQETPLIPTLSNAILKDLFGAGRSVLKLQPWKHLHDTDWFGIKDPDTDEIHVVATMGKADQFYAIQVYLPEEGIRFWNHFIETGEPDVLSGQYDQRMLSCEFVTWNEFDMDEHDMDLNEQFEIPEIENTGELDSLLFRSTLPGCANWHPETHECHQLLDALRLLPRFHQYHLDSGSETSEWHIDGTPPKIPCFGLPRGAKRSDSSAWEMSIIYFPKAAPEPPILEDDLFASRLAKLKIQKGKRWEIGSTYLPEGVIHNGRPTWVALTTVGLCSDEFSVGSELLPVTERREVMLRKSFTKAALELGYLPEILGIRSELARQTFAPLSNITLEMSEKLPVIDKIFATVIGEMSHGESGNPLADLPPETIAELEKLMEKPPSSMNDQESIEFLQKLMELEGSEKLMGSFMETEQAQGSSSDYLPSFDDLALLEMELDELEPREKTQQASPTLDQGHYIFRIDLDHMKPPIWRRLSIDASATFAQLHQAIQDLFDWNDGHLHAFYLKDAGRIVATISNEMLEINEDDWDENKLTLSQVFGGNIKKLHYIYDFGDNWSHTIKLEKKSPLTEPEKAPQCLAGRGMAPLEDCGGYHGFQELLAGRGDFVDEYPSEQLERLRNGKFSPKDVIFG